jgi:hypothetical protein
MRWQRIMFVGVRHSPATWPWARSQVAGTEGQGGDWRVPPGSTTTTMMMAMVIGAWRPREMDGDGWRCSAVRGCVWVSGGFALDTSTNTGSPGCRLTQAVHLHCFPEGGRVNTSSAVACLGPAILSSSPSPSLSLSLLSLSLLESVALFSLHPPLQPSPHSPEPPPPPAESKQQAASSSQQAAASAAHIRASGPVRCPLSVAALVLAAPSAV